MFGHFQGGFPLLNRHLGDFPKRQERLAMILRKFMENLHFVKKNDRNPYKNGCRPDAMWQKGLP